ncbi:hypothetical protein [Blastococcus sp. CT_GayMR16]|uniref:hypothetical protein n=1 Tax=Blastococcus sp. CT_GayMR16 TaxID=2559607 RepID=UPI0010731ED8|nr:hypothetical protein [Blastococcus sp. CT_GayMR16]TFV87145.1 hypothetical protein E4P38_14425 [Blastococcus sp. CT_GayMR16]
MSGDGLPGDLWEETGAEGEPIRDRPQVWLSAALTVVAVAFLAVAVHGVFTVVGDLLGWAGDNALHIAGESPPSGREVLREDVLALTLRASCVAGIGVVLGLWRGRGLAVAVFGGAVVVSLVVGLTTYAIAAKNRPDRPSWEDDPRGCVELSGEPSDCP